MYLLFLQQIQYAPSTLKCSMAQLYSKIVSDLIFTLVLNDNMVIFQCILREYHGVTTIPVSKNHIQITMVLFC